MQQGRTRCVLEQRLTDFALLAVFAVFVGQPVAAGNTALGRELPEDLTELNLEELVKIKVTSFAKKQQDLSHTAGAVYVVTAEEIRRSGATIIPEVLRMVPGIQVARIDANKWAISSRGFNGRFANKLVVMIDGRTVYTQSFSGVYWDMEDTPMENIDRVEVIRGPGATMWGANAVNGVINVITKPASETQGGQITSGGGNQEGRFGSVRYGGAIGDKARYRVFGRYGKRNRSVTALGEKAQDDWDTTRGGFRLDWDLSDEDTLTFSGDLFEGNANSTVLLPDLSPPFLIRQAGLVDTSGGHFLTRWDHLISEESDLSLKFSFDRSDRYEEFLYGVKRNTADADFQHRFRPMSRHEILWGGGFRSSSDHAQNTSAVNIDPAGRILYYRNAFIQDEIEVLPESLYLTVGSKFEHTSLAGFQIQPNARIMWLPHSRHSIWVSASRAVRNPSRTEQDGEIAVLVIPGSAPTNLPLLGFATGNRDYESEVLQAYQPVAEYPVFRRREAAGWPAAR
ncbi:MAG: TonB-dependent receptor plug domain-containing protein, partial [Acidobacteria bacterium]|nr:TonB-dependent receptor plug domain-containing protein [Acidobacteriota bacterium]